MYWYVKSPIGNYVGTGGVLFSVTNEWNEENKPRTNLAGQMGLKSRYGKHVLQEHKQWLLYVFFIKCSFLKKSQNYFFNWKKHAQWSLKMRMTWTKTAIRGGETNSYHKQNAMEVWMHPIEVHTLIYPYAKIS